MGSAASTKLWNFEEEKLTRMDRLLVDVETREKLAALLPSFSGGREEQPFQEFLELLLNKKSIYILFDDTLKYLEPKDIVSLTAINKNFYSQANDESSMFYYSLCKSVILKYRLYFPLNKNGNKEYKIVLFDEILQYKQKWKLNSNQNEQSEATQNFNIEVNIRFRPVRDPNSKAVESHLLVPLHQRLMLKTAIPIQSEPEEFKDALLGGIMKNPCSLPTSGYVCDRSAIVAQLRRSPYDPFNNLPLQVEQLCDLPELRQRILDWKQAKNEQHQNENYHKLDHSAIDKLVDTINSKQLITPEALAALSEVQKLEFIGNRCELDALSGDAQSNVAMEDRLAYDSMIRIRQQQLEQQQQQQAAAELYHQHHLQEHHPSEPADDIPGSTHDALESKLERFSAYKPKRDKPKVLKIAPPTAVTMYDPNAGVRPYLFSRVFDDDADQRAVYDSSVRKSVVATLNGFDTCIMCYGQTSSGKSYTMFGGEQTIDNIFASSQRRPQAVDCDGLVLRAMRELMEIKKKELVPCTAVTVSCQYVQIYQDKIRCLLGNHEVKIRSASELNHTSTHSLVNAEQYVVNNMKDVLEVLRIGEERKIFAETAMNHRSSRAHTVVIVSVQQVSGNRIVTSKLHLVDLAGSERVKKSKAVGVNFEEAVGINSSLLALGNCIRALSEEHHHVPYHNSKLTLLLRQALGGNNITTMIICAHKDESDAEETLQSLRFGECCSLVQNKTAVFKNVCNMQDVVARVTDALQRCEQQIDSLTHRGKQHLPAFKKLMVKYNRLKRHRDGLAVF